MGSDVNIAELFLHHELELGEGYVVNGGYRRIRGAAWTPTGLYNMIDRTKALARAPHEYINGRFKEFTCLKITFRHNRADHYHFFVLCALLMQLVLEDKESTFQVEYDEREFGHDSN